MGIDFDSIPRCEENKAFVRRMVTGEARGSLAYLVPITHNGEKAEPEYSNADFHNDFEKPMAKDMAFQKLFERNLAWIAGRQWEHDHGVPMIPAGFFCGGGVLATAFGARYDPVRNWTHPIATSPEEIESLPLDVTLSDGLIPRALEAIEYFASKTEGRIPIAMYNTGGPMDIVTHAMNDQDFLLALSLYPEACHRVLDVCTELFIDFMKAQQRIVAEWSPCLISGAYWPDGEGILCGEDWLAVISPKMALEFEIPYINRISDAFGGVFVHACGTLEINYKTLKDHVRNLRGLYFHAGESSFPKAVELFRGTDVVLIVDWLLNQHYPFKSRLDYVRHILEAKSPDVSVYLLAGPGIDPASREEDPNAASQEVLRMLDKYVTEGVIE